PKHLDTFRRVITPPPLRECPPVVGGRRAAGDLLLVVRAKIPEVVVGSWRGLYTILILAHEPKRANCSCCTSSFATSGVAFLAGWIGTKGAGSEPGRSKTLQRYRSFASGRRT